MNTQYIRLNMVPAGVLPVMHTSQFDIGRPLGIVVYDGSAEMGMDDYTVTIEATRTDGTPITAAVTTDGNVGAFVTTATMTNKDDLYPAQLVIVDGDSNRVASLPFMMRVVKAAMDENSEAIEEDAPLYQQYNAAIQAMLASIRADLNTEVAARETAVAAEATTRAAADITLQDNINSEASTRQSQDSLLQTQINQIVAPTGEAPSAAEVENARIGTDGITYSTLGVAIRNQFTNVKSQLEDVQESTLSFLPISTTWENGLFDANGYQDLPSSTVTMKRSTKLPAGTYIITPTSGLRWEAFYYVSDSSGTQIYSFSSSKRTFTATGQFIITIGRTGGGSLDGLEVEISQFGIQRQNDELINIRNINHDSLAVNTDRYEHITYIDRLTGATLGIGTASSVRTDFDVRFKDAPYSVCMTTNSERTNTEIRLNYDNAFTLLGTQEFELYIYIKDATVVTGARIQIPSAGFTQSNTQLVNGWNKIRLLSEGAGNWTENTDITQIRIMVYHTSGATEDVYIGSVVQVKPQYANLILIADGPYYSTYSAAYPALKTMGVPITWALDATLLDAVDAQTRGLINMNELNLLAKDGISEFSFHSYDGTLMSSASKEQALYDTLNSIRFLRENGLQPNHIWRAAWLQNSCAAPELANLEVEASASYNGASGVTVFPFNDKYNIARFGIAGRDTSWFDSIFNKLRRQHCTALLYFHGVSNAEKDITQTMLEYFLDKIEDAISDGYLNPTTYNRLVSYYKKVE